MGLMDGIGAQPQPQQPQMPNAPDLSGAVQAGQNIIGSIMDFAENAVQDFANSDIGQIFGAIGQTSQFMNDMQAWQDQQAMGALADGIETIAQAQADYEATQAQNDRMAMEAAGNIAASAFEGAQQMALNDQAAQEAKFAQNEQNVQDGIQMAADAFQSWAMTNLQGELQANNIQLQSSQDMANFLGDFFSNWADANMQGEIAISAQEIANSQATMQVLGDAFRAWADTNMIGEENANQATIQSAQDNIQMLNDVGEMVNLYYQDQIQANIANNEADVAEAQRVQAGISNVLNGIVQLFSEGYDNEARLQANEQNQNSPDTVELRHYEP